ncbi:DUF1361 domain-containing protein [Dethiobacter alkaliphilus]|uniref:DUF1361 domain-containing protein n=1 Tax=Dethiobacter alkaliphilus TaxID=427926 RepID=UPI002226C512|nr:DUF1361 domain-containing protein [Dethiobacter alkaliphilus]MCW3491657.1 DUF1361 domain-containing protein [Dethiobacter alkaliphilus]
MHIINENIPAWFPRDLINPFLYLISCSILVTGLFFIPFFDMYLQGHWWWLPWNIFLAWLPLFFALCLLWAVHGEQSRLLIITCWGLWLFFYPNAPYMLTDLIHLNRFEFVIGTQFSADPAVWFGFLHLVAGVAVGCGFGLLSLVMLQRYTERTRGAVWSWLLVAGTSLLSGIGIWIGRNLRFNSWDILFRPFHLLRNIASQFDRNAFLLCLLFTIMCAGAHLLVVSFNKEVKDERGIRN